MSDNSQPPPMSLPKEMKYSDLLPVGVKAQRRKNIFRPSGGQNFGPKKTNKILIDVHGDFFQSCRTSYLQFALKNVSGASKSHFLDGSAHSLIQSIVIRAGSREIERIDDYNVLHAMLADATVTKDYRSTCGSAMEGYGDGDSCFPNAQVDAVDANGSTPAVIGEPAKFIDEDYRVDENERSNLKMPDYLCKHGEEHVFCLNLATAFLTSERYIPLVALRGSAGYQIEITLADGDVAFYAAAQKSGAGDTAQAGSFTDGRGTVYTAALNFPIENPVQEVDYELSQVEYHVDAVYFSGDFNRNFVLHMQQMGGIQWAGVSYSHSTHVQLNPAGNASFPISHRHKSVKSLMSIFRNSGHINDVNNKSVTKRLAQHMQSYHYKIGGVQYPEYPVEVGVGQGKLAPAATQLELVFGKLGDRVNSNCIDRYNFSPDLDQWQRAGCNNVVSKMIYSVELETYGSNSSLLESGISTDSGSPNMMFSCNLGNNVTGNMRIDTYAMYDCIFSILPDQSLSVQH